MNYHVLQRLARPPCPGCVVKYVSLGLSQFLVGHLRIDATGAHQRYQLNGTSLRQRCVGFQLWFRYRPSSQLDQSKKLVLKSLNNKIYSTHNDFREL